MATRLKLRGLVLTAAELRKLTDWPDSLVEDYLNILNNLIELADEIDRRSGILKNTVLVNPTSYLLSSEDQLVFCNTDLGDIQINLPSGTNGAEYRIINAGSSGHTVNIIPNLGETIFSGSSQMLYDREVLDIAFNEFEGWT